MGNGISFQRDETAVLFRRYADTVYRLAYARVKNQYDADDILQEVFLRFLRSKNPPQDEEHTKALLLRITLNCSKSFFTTAARRHNVPLTDTVAQPPENRETLDAVLRLPKKYRTVLHLHYYCGYSIDEIAELLRQNPSTVKSQLHRAREKLRVALKGVEF